MSLKARDALGVGLADHLDLACLEMTPVLGVVAEADVDVAAQQRRDRGRSTLERHLRELAATGKGLDLLGDELGGADGHGRRPSSRPASP